MEANTKTDTKTKTIIITLTDRRPLRVTEDRWPIIAEAEDATDHNGQEKFRRYYLRVRGHVDDGRCVVYGRSESSYQGEATERSGYLCALDETPETIRRVGEAIGASEWLMKECMSKLPAEDGE